MWDGETVAILASGASMTAKVAAVVMTAGVKTIAINRTVELAPSADMLYASDAVFWQRETAKQFKGMKVSIFPDGEIGRNFQLPPDDVLMLKNTGIEGFDPDPSALRTGNNGGYQALHLAAHAGARRVLLCGYNMKGSNWHGRYALPFRNTPQGKYPLWCQIFNGLAKALQGRGIEVLNCTPGSALDAFPRCTLQEALLERAVA